MQQASSEPAPLTVALNDDGDRMSLEGALDIRTLAEATRSFKKWRTKHKSRVLDLGKLRNLDTPGALLLCGLRDRGVELTGVRAEHKSLLDLIGGLELKPQAKLESVSRGRQFVIQLGKAADDAWHDMLDVITFVGRATSLIGHALIHPRSLRLASISRHILETGVHALPIVGLMAVMISI